MEAPISLTFTLTVTFAMAKQAVQQSSVKISGRDVLATWKLLISLVFLPSLWIFYTFASGELLRRLGAPLFWQVLPTSYLLPPPTSYYLPRRAALLGRYGDENGPHG